MITVEKASVYNRGDDKENKVKQSTAGQKILLPLLQVLTCCLKGGT